MITNKVCVGKFKMAQLKLYIDLKTIEFKRYFACKPGKADITNKCCTLKMLTK